MKKYFMKFGDIVWGVIILLSILCIPQNVGAEGGYPKYLNGNRHLIICGGHMGYGAYIDTTSLVVEEYNPPIYKLAINVLTVKDADRGNTTVDSMVTTHFMYNWDSKRMYQTWQSDDRWHYIAPVGDMAETGHYFAGEMAFYLAYSMKFYGGREWYHERTRTYLKPNFSDDIYTLVDGAR